MRETRPTILYVAHNPKSRRLLACVFTDCGFEVVVAADPAEALEQFRKTSFNLALLEYHLPQISGPELARKLKEAHAGLPIVMISNCAVMPSVELLFVDAHFGSGTALDDLIATMRTLLRPSSVRAREPFLTGPWADST